MGWRLPEWRRPRGLRIMGWRRALVAWVQGNTGSFAGVLASAGLGLTIAPELVEWMDAQPDAPCRRFHVLIMKSYVTLNPIKVRALGMDRVVVQPQNLADLIE